MSADALLCVMRFIEYVGCGRKERLKNEVRRQVRVNENKERRAQKVRKRKSERKEGKTEKILSSKNTNLRNSDSQSGATALSL